MPGNEVGDRVHNFFGQENLPQGQHHSQPIDGNWPGLSSNPWVGGQRQIGGPFISGLKNYNVPQPEPERGHGSQPAHMPHGLNYMQPNLMPEFGRVQSPSPQPALNGYVHGNQAFQGRQNEASFLGMDSDTNRHNMLARGLSMSQQGNNAPEHNKKIPMRLDASESPVSFDFFGGQQPMSGQHQLNVMQPLPRQQQSANNDMQLLQRHMMLQQIQELQRHQQLQQLETRQQGFANQKQAGVSHPPSMINGVPVNEASNNMWQPELVPGGASWLQRGASPVMQGSSSGHMFAADQGQALRLMDMVPQQADQSLYGVPISSTSGSPSFYSHAQMDKAAMHQISVNNDFVSGNNQYATFLDQVNMQDQEKNNFGSAIGQGLENLQQVNHQQRIPPTQELAESSEPSQEKSFNDAGSSQNAATLDPTEEKILFGSDDNIWEAFGGGTTKGGMGNYNNMLDGAEFSSGFSALQSGSWSALMQSAVAESSSGDAGAQEEWCGPTVQNSDALMGNQQLSSTNHGGKLQGVWGGDNNFQPASKANSTVNSFGLPQLQQPDYKSPQVQGDASHIDSSQRSVPKFSEQGSKWSDRGHPQRQPVEASQMYGGISHQNTPSHNSDAHSYSRKNGWNFIDSVSTDGGENFRTPENKNNFQPAQSSEGKRGMHDELGHVAATWRVDSSPKSNAELELPTKSSIGSPRVGRNASSLNNIAVANSSNMRPNQEGNQLPNSQKLDFWKVIDSSVGSKGAESMGKNQHSFGKSSQILESSGNHHSSDREMVDLHEVDNSINKDTSTDGFNSLNHTFGNSSKDNNVWSDGGDSCTIPGNKQKYSGNTGRKPPGARKFQYHPMGDVDVDNEPSYGTKQVTHSQNLRSKGYDQGSIDPSKFAVQMDKSSFESEKGHGPISQADTKGFDPTASKSMFPGFVPNTASFGRGIGNFAPSKVPSSSQHMLELLHKVDHAREHGTPTHLSSSERNLSSEMPEPETSDGSVSHVQRNQPSNSQNFGLQLAPPSQRLSNPEHAVSSQNSKPGFGSPHAIPESAEKGPMLPTSRSSAMPYSLAHEPSQGHGNKKASYTNAQGSYSTAFPSGFPYTRNLESQHMHAASGQIMANQAAHMPYNRISTGPKQLDDSSERAQASQFVPSPVSDFPANAPQSNLASSSEVFQKKDLVQQIMESDRGRLAPSSVHQNAFPKMSPNSWTSVSREQPSLSSQPSIAASGLFKSQLQSKLNEQDTVDGRSELSGIEIISADSQSFIAKEQPDNDKTLTGSQGNESAVNNFPESSNPGHTATQRDIEAFGRSLRPNNSLRDNYSLLHQVQAMKSTEIESTDRSGKRLKGSEHAMDPLQAGPPLPYGYSSGSRDSLANQSGDQQMLNFSAKIGETCESNSSSQNVSNNFPMNRGNVPLRGELPQISPRMAPSWFDQYGSFKNGQTLQAYDVLRSSAIKPIEQPLVVANPSDDQQAHSSEKSHVLGEIQQLSAAKSVVTEQITSPHSTPHASDEALVVERPKKRKTATSELVPWNKELIDVSQRLQTISMAEAHWAGATKRLAEKVEEGEMAEDAPPVLRPRRRLILTTQLMQQLLRPPPASVLFSDPNSQTESATYFSARYALADACNAAGCSESEAPLPGEDKNLSSEKVKTPKIIDLCLSKVEDFIGRARKLENELLRLDKRASILDLRVECQDLEKFSVINRFAKFHGRGQADGGDATSSASDGTLTSQKTCPQKYVTGLPPPRNLPDRVQCLSL